MVNVNLSVKRKQIKIITYCVLGLIIVVGGGFIFNKIFLEKKKVVEPVTMPKLDGVFTETFGDNYTKSALKETNAKTSQVEKQLDELRSDVQNKERALIQLQSDFNNLKNSFEQKLTEQQKLLANFNGNSTKEIGGYGQDFGNSNNQQYIDRNLSYRKIQAVSTNDSLLTVKNPLPYIPSGSFAKAMIVEGADANASVTGGNNTVPMQFTLTGNIKMPNSEEFDATGCFITAEVYGDISSERGEVRTRNISCKRDGKTIDMKFKGHVAYMGKNGIRGTAIMRNGKIIAWAGASGLLSGLGSGVQTASQTVAGVGATAKASPQDILTGAFGGAFEKSATTLSEYYIKRAEQYHPIIEINANNEVTVMFQEGFQLNYLEDVKNGNEKDLIKKAQMTLESKGQELRGEFNSSINEVKKQNPTFNFQSLSGQKIIN